jgi:large subunit ribosomal protein L24
VTLVDAERNRVVVEGVNLVKRHTKPNPQKQVQGGIVEQEAAIHASNVMLVDPASGKRTRVGMRVEGDRKVRVSRRKDGGVIDK